MAKTTAAKRTIDQITEDITHDINNLNLAVNDDTDNQKNQPRKIYKATTPKPN